MNPTLQAFAQSVYLAIKNRHYEDIEDEDGQEYVSQIVDFTNQYLDELQYATDNNDQPVQWDFLRQPDATLGTATTGARSISTPRTVDMLLTGEMRYVRVLQDSTPVSYWAVVAPGDIANKTNRIVEDTCSQIGPNIVFSRPFTDAESGGIITGDVSILLPEVTITSVKALQLVKPRQLLVLGVAKNSSLPDIVRGKLSPSFVQRHDKLLQDAIARSQRSSQSIIMPSQDYSYVRGVSG